VVVRASAGATHAIRKCSLYDASEYAKIELDHRDLDAHTTPQLMKTATALHRASSRLVQSVLATPVIPNSINAAPELAQVGYDLLST